MAEQNLDIEAQLDALLAEAQLGNLSADEAEEAASPSPPPIGPEPQNRGPQPATTSEKRQPVGQSADEPMMDQIDQMLADEADGAISGEFQTIDQIAGDQDVEQAPAAAASAEPESNGRHSAAGKFVDSRFDETAGEDQRSVAEPDVEDERSLEGDLDEMLDGAFETVEQVTGEASAPDDAPAEAAADDDSQAGQILTAEAPPQDPTEPSAPPQASPKPAASKPAPSTEQGSAAAVAAELDAADVESAKKNVDSELDAAAKVQTNAEPPEPSRSDTADLEAATRISPIDLLAMSALPAHWRDAIGFAGLQTLCVAICLLIYKAFGGLTAIISAVVFVAPMSMLFYLMFVRRCRAENCDDESDAATDDGEPTS